MVKRRNRKKAKRIARSPHAPELQCNNRHKQNIVMLNVLGNGPNCVTSQWSLTTAITLSEHLCQMKRNSLEEFLRHHSQKNRRSQRPWPLTGKVNPLFLWAFVQTYWNFPEGVQEISHNASDHSCDHYVLHFKKTASLRFIDIVMWQMHKALTEFVFHSRQCKSEKVAHLFCTWCCALYQISPPIIWILFALTVS